MVASVPKHVGLIPDGTRRWSRKNRRSLDDSYNLTMEGIAQFVDQAYCLGVSSLSIFLLSCDNLKRATNEVASVLNAEILFIESMLPPLVRSHNIRVTHAGRLDLLPSSYATALSSLCSKSKDRVGKRLYLLSAYDPSDELNQAAARASLPMIERLWVPEYVDLVIRTGGNSRLSGFLPMQCSYAELSFSPLLFNDAQLNRLIEPILAFDSASRKFGR